MSRGAVDVGKLSGREDNLKRKQKTLEQDWTAKVLRN